MVKYLFILSFSFAFFTTSKAQKRFNAEKKYAVVLPERWKASPKLLLKITDIVSEYVPELTDKQECLNCGANYWIKFYVSALQVDNISYRTVQEEFITQYRFLGFLDVYNIDGYLLRRLFINNKKEIYSITSRPFNLGKNNEEKSFSFDAEGYIRQNTYKLIPNEDQLWDQLEEVIKDLRIAKN